MRSQPIHHVLSSVLLAIGASVALAGDVGTRADRGALFDWLVEKTLQRESFSDVKYERLGVDVEAAMHACRDDVVDAQTEVDLYYALAKLSAARFDRHLEVYEIRDGLDLDPAFRELAGRMGHADDRDLEAPVRFKAGFANAESPEVFVADIGKPKDGAAQAERVAVTDRVVSINGLPVDEFVDRVRPYWRHSTPANFWARLARDLNTVTRAIPPSLYKPRLELGLVDSRGDEYGVSLPYYRADDIAWEGVAVRRYPGFRLREDFVSFDIYEPTDGQRVVLLQWYGFRDDLVEATDRLMVIAKQEAWLDHDLIIDCTLSRGGSKGAYAVQRLSPRPFKTTFGNLRLSDAALAFSVGVLESHRQGRQSLDGGITETVDGGGWLVDWLTSDVLPAFAAGHDYSNNVPFKCAHASRFSAGIIQPARDHFRGRMVCWFGPHGGSHLDQFASIVVDNGLAHTMGMPTGGYSNTWEWEEDVRFPTSGAPVVGYMWSIGHTIRPNGEVLEGNPAAVDEWAPVTRQNYRNYYADMTRKSLAHLDRSAAEGGPDATATRTALNDAPR